jgi:hypothetical protein
MLATPAMINETRQTVVVTASVMIIFLVLEFGVSAAALTYSHYCAPGAVSFNRKLIFSSAVFREAV